MDQNLLVFDRVDTDHAEVVYLKAKMGSSPGYRCVE